MKAFLEIHVTGTVTPPSTPAAASTAGPVVAEIVALPDAARRECHAAAECPQLLASRFRLIDTRTVDVPLGQGGEAVHLTYTDGISAVSLFVQRGHLAEAIPDTSTLTWDGAQVHVGNGWPIRVMWQGDDCVFTVISDAPPDTVQAVVESLPHGGSGGGGPLDGVSRGVRAVLGLLG
jgi:hypothetical protein